MNCIASQTWFGSVRFGERGHHLRVLCNKCGVDAIFFKEVANQFVNKTRCVCVCVCVRERVSE